MKRLLIYSLNSKNQEPRNSFLDVIFVQVEYFVYLFEISRTFQIHYFFSPIITYAVSILFQSELLLAFIGHTSFELFLIFWIQGECQETS